MLRINLSRDAEKFLKRLPPRHGKQLSRKLQQISDNPFQHDAERMKGYPYLRADMGEYRIIYEVGQDTVGVLLIGKRNDDEIYKKLRRK